MKPCEADCGCTGSCCGQCSSGAAHHNTAAASPEPEQQADAAGFQPVQRRRRSRPVTPPGTAASPAPSAASSAEAPSPESSRLSSLAVAPASLPGSTAAAQHSSTLSGPRQRLQPLGAGAAAAAAALTAGQAGPSTDLSDQKRLAALPDAEQVLSCLLRQSECRQAVLGMHINAGFVSGSRSACAG